MGILTKGRVLAVLAVVLIVGLAGFAFACGDDDGGASEEEIQEVEEILRQLFESDATNADFVFAHVTDNLIETAFFTTREDCEANADECLGPATVDSISDIEISGDSATAVVDVDFGTFDVMLVREDDVWKGDSLQARSDELPDDAAVVDLALTDFAFNFNSGDFPSDGNFGFNVTNDGEQAHEVIVIAIPPEMTLEEALDTLEGPEDAVALKLYINPGQQVDMALNTPLAAGNYGLVCFFPDTDDPEGASHFDKGMLAEFTIE